MAKHGSWTVIFEDKLVIKKNGEYGIGVNQNLVTCTLFNLQMITLIMIR